MLQGIFGFELGNLTHTPSEFIYFGSCPILNKTKCLFLYKKYIYVQIPKSRKGIKNILVTTFIRLTGIPLALAASCRTFQQKTQ